MKYGSIYSKDNIENKYNYSSTGGRRSSQNNFKTSHDHHTHSTLNTDGQMCIRDRDIPYAGQELLMLPLQNK